MLPQEQWNSHEGADLSITVSQLEGTYLKAQNYVNYEVGRLGARVIQCGQTFQPVEVTSGFHSTNIYSVSSNLQGAVLSFTSHSELLLTSVLRSEAVKGR